ncbi:MAG: hypothetical protein A3A43_03345 [Candidatus Liptonbacteria bacterium RIFCSPLOWO2_01_FULL_56_20]|uniref:Peptidase S51 n=1 Tax=Candidatus Liptonbacteria bacterium RIFCSPLOWO2_01_FULL_56_20 TaxID=1798652 RepID=A0A1G2CN31_9BACT|nr:MAG: hypothetical protein A3A43_03345 [Candidatus Liptonbacteria bacterium RIFCSPLOWO2_01_FULL_56_20]
MKTKFILHGGFTTGEKQENNPFFQEILSSAPSETKVLLVYFAKEPDRIAKNREEDIEQFNRDKGDKILSFEVATEDLFPEQVKKADVIYLHGGHSGKLLDALKKFPNLGQLFGGKIIAGDSAGANVLTAAFYSQKIGVSEGFGLVPIKIISHYREENKDKLNEVRPELDTLFLPEYHFKVFYSDTSHRKVDRS